MKLSVIKLKGYREWTESLGYDREWKIQSFQHNFLSTLTNLASEINSFVITYRYDSYIMLIDGVKTENISYFLNKIQEISPVPIEPCFGYGKSPLEAEENCNYYEIEKINEINDDKILVAHFDLDGFSTKRQLFKAYLEVYEIYNTIFSTSMKLGGLPYYFGGDNIGVFLSANNLKDIVEMIKDLSNVKVGVGIGNNPKESLKNATKALDTIRLFRDRKIEIVET